MQNSSAIAEDFKQYAYSVSHDVGGPVRAMVEFSRLLIEDHAAALNDEGKEYLSLIVDNGRKLQAMMDGLLRYSRLDTLARPFAEVNTREIAENARNVMQDQILESKGIVDIGDLPAVLADAEQLMHLFCILISNGLTYQTAGNKPQLRIAAELMGNAWRFTVTDNGIGVPAERRDVIFHVFKRLHADSEYPGVGMGLALARKIVERHDGAIGCEAATPRGSIFYFTLPTLETCP